MAGQRIDGREISEKIYQGLKDLHESKRKRVTFAVFNTTPAILSFIERKEEIAHKVGIETIRIERTPRTTEEAISVIEDLNASDTNGIVVQLPLPEGVDTEAVLGAVEPDLDVDLLGAETKKQFINGETKRLPPVAGAVMEMLGRSKISLLKKRIVVLGRGKLVGEPVGMLFEREGIPFDHIDKETSNEEILGLLSQADIIISGIGVPHFILPEMVKDGVVIIDAGTSESGGKLAGDMHPDTASKTSFYTPVPGGVGPVTVAVLYRNLFAI